MRLDKELELAELPEGYVPSQNEEYMNKFQLEYFRRKLLNKKNEILAESIDNDTLNLLREESKFPPDQNDCATQENNIRTLIQKRERNIKLIKAINDAIQRIKDGEYGYCEKTGEEIGIRRLEVNPLTMFSIDAQEKFEKHTRSHNPNIYEEEGVE